MALVGVCWPLFRRIVREVGLSGPKFWNSLTRRLQTQTELVSLAKLELLVCVSAGASCQEDDKEERCKPARKPEEPVARPASETAAETAARSTALCSVCLLHAS